ncbi:hypothetical protein [Actinokineospora inagensis]|uniref:hypothetical protein n=1 Tax=Actinokineospora inagensis TaxID=103730 RepID=UPI00041577A2|nr:hypothetical protein [Actinokineospora inagensis]
MSEWSAELATVTRAVTTLADRLARWPNGANPVIGDARTAVKLTAEFFKQLPGAVDAHAKLREAVAGRDGMTEMLRELRSIVDLLDGCFHAIDNGRARTRGPAKLRELANRLCERLDEFLVELIAVANQAAEVDRVVGAARNTTVEVVTQTKHKIDLWYLEAEGAQEPTPAVDPSDVAAYRLAKHFREHEEKETRLANRWRLAVVGLLVIITASAVTITLVFHTDLLTTDLVRLSATIPAAVLAGYVAKESARHRAAAKWSGELSIALRTLVPYTEPLGDQGAELRRALGLRVFGAPVMEKAEGLGVDLVERLEALVRRLLDREGKS